MDGSRRLLLQLNQPDLLSPETTHIRDLPEVESAASGGEHVMSSGETRRTFRGESELPGTGDIRPHWAKADASEMNTRNRLR